jgi:endonuclease/exonuclease/phosphatase family metal-dependent hydrolase
VTVERGWVSVDAKVRGKTFRFINTHLEPIDIAPQAQAAIQLAQATELLQGPANTSLPVVLVGDFNSPADGSGTDTYEVLVGAGFEDTWSQTHPGDPGYTWGHDADLQNEDVNLTQRLDLVLFRGDLRALSADIVGEDPADRTPSGLWPSDHAGVVATLGIHVRPQHAPRAAAPSPVAAVPFPPAGSGPWFVAGPARGRSHVPTTTLGLPWESAADLWVAW